MVIAKIWRLLENVGLCLILPAVVLHELTHWIAARGVADDIRLHYQPDPAVSVNWKADVPTWRLRLAKIAPTLVGLALTPLLAYWLVRGQWDGLISVIIVTALWAVYTKPSADDLRPPAV